MKKFWIVLLALGLVAGFAMSASAADVKFSGSYYVYGMYVDNVQFRKDIDRTLSAQAFYQQRLRIQTQFKIAEGLSLVTRFDALEKAWGHFGATSWRNDAGIARYDVTNRLAATTSDARTQENIEWEQAYIDFTTKIGRFNIGYQNFVNWGTWFLDTPATRAGIKYFVPVGPVTIVAALEKTADQNVGNGIMAAGDSNIYDLGAMFKFGAGEAGILYQYGDNNTNRRAAVGVSEFSTKMHIINPYAKVKFGPVFVEAEGVYGFGKIRDQEVPGVDSIDAEAMGLYLHAKADIGPAYVGGQFAYMRGDKKATADKQEGTFAAALYAGQTYDPCLILWNNALYGGQHRLGTPVGVFFDNAYLYQLYAGFKPVKEADIMLSVSYALADRRVIPTSATGTFGVTDRDIGWEIDLVAKYKIFDNLEYMIGGAYLVAGDFFKAVTTTGTVIEKDNNYMLIHKLTLSF